MQSNRWGMMGSGKTRQLVESTISRAIRVVAYYVMSIALIVSSNSLIGHVQENTAKSLILLMALLVLATAFFIIAKGVEKRFLLCWTAWTCLLVAVYLTVSIANGDWGNDYQKGFFFLLAVMPLFVHLLGSVGDTSRFLTAFTNIMCVLAALSLVFWLFGSILNVIPTNCIIDNTWNHTGKHVTTAGYFHVDYETQLLWLGDLVFWRNSGVFVEAPLYSFALSCALVFEWAFQEKARIAPCVLLSVTIVTTCSVTGIVVVAALMAFGIVSRVKSGKGKAVAIAILAVVAIAASVLVAYKLSTESGGTRVDDFRAGFLAWLDSPLAGNGLDNNSAIIAHMSAFRSDNLGFSSGLAYVVASGGILLLIPYLAAFTGYFVPKSPKYMLAGALFAFLWAVTIVQTLSLTALLLAIGVEMALQRISISGNFPSPTVEEPSSPQT